MAPLRQPGGADGQGNLDVALAGFTDCLNWRALMADQFVDVGGVDDETAACMADAMTAEMAQDAAEAWMTGSDDTEVFDQIDETVVSCFVDD